MSGIGKSIGFLPDPLNIHKSKEDGGLGFPDPLGLFDSLPKPKEVAPIPQELETPSPMPLPSNSSASSASVTAKRKSVAVQRGRKGRRSTILTALDDNEGVLGA